MKDKSDRETNTGTLSGMAMRTNVPKLESPSNLAASVSSSGSPVKYCRMKNTLPAEPNSPGMMSGRGPFVQPMVSNSR